MKLANYLTWKQTLLLGIVFSLWAVIYFFMQIHVIHRSVDEGLLYLKQEFILEANTKDGYIESMLIASPVNMRVREVDVDIARKITDEFVTTDVFLKSEEEQEKVRMLTSAFYCKLNNKYYIIQFFTSVLEFEDLISSILTLLIVLLLTITISLWVGSRIIIKNSSKPFFQLLHNLRNFDLNNIQMIDFPKTKINEYIQLNKTIERLLKKNIQVYEDQKIFIENASHEIQTPLAVINAKVETLLNREDLDESVIVELANIYNNIARMKRLNKNLLLLSKIRNHQFPDTELVDMEVELSHIIKDFEPQIEYKEIEYVMKIKDRCSLLMNKDLAHILLSNLLKNAINYNVKQGSILVEISKDKLMIANTGTPNEDQQDIFERYKSLHKSTGLGLSIVKSIVELYNLQIEYTYENGWHKVSILA